MYRMIRLIIKSFLVLFSVYMVLFNLKTIETLQMVIFCIYPIVIILILKKIQKYIEKHKMELLNRILKIITKVNFDHPGIFSV